MDQSAQPLTRVEINMQFPDGHWKQITIDAGEWAIFYRESETDHTNDTSRKHIPEHWDQRHEVCWTKRQPAGPKGQRPGTALHDRVELALDRVREANPPDEAGELRDQKADEPRDYGQYGEVVREP